VRTLLVPAPLVDGEVIVGGDEAHHGLHVLRLGPGDAVRLADGAGQAAAGEVIACGRHDLRLRVAAVETISDGPLAQLTVVCAPPKGDRFADLVRGLTELGVGAIRPLVCARASPPVALDRLRRVAAEALKQCRRGTLPVIGPLLEFTTLVTTPGRRIVLDRGGASCRPGPPRETTLIVGPEGGFTAEESAQLVAAGVERMRLAGPVLRIETAALAAAAVWAAAWESP